MKFLKYILFVVFFFFSFLLFLPKLNLYFALEKQLKKYDLIISDEKFISTLTGFELRDAKIYVKGVDIATVKSLKVSLGGVDIVSKDIGVAHTKVDMAKKSIVVNFKPTRSFVNKYQIVLKYFKKQKNGDYSYEYKLF
jgi:hypothetical protein